MKYRSCAAYIPEVPHSKSLAIATALDRAAKEIADKNLDVSEMQVKFVEDHVRRDYYIDVTFEAEGGKKLEPDGLEELKEIMGRQKLTVAVPGPESYEYLRGYKDGVRDSLKPVHPPMN